ncbi:MAG TPA: histidinol-phosphate transaminase [Candidatus Cloacimonadota bacterium]|nr:histidinol-phosphate transaminase [Candidatus Cloacimonadota bacterium]
MYRFRKDLQQKPEMKIEVQRRKHMMCLNESPLNPFEILGEQFIEKMKNGELVNRYLSDVSAELKQALADYVGFGIKPEQILFGNGADEMLYYLFTAVREDNNSFAISLAPSYFDYKTYSGSVGLKIHQLPLNEDFNFSIEDYIQYLRDPHCKLAILCNPNNPTGHMIPDKKIIHVLQNTDIPVIVDETYFEYSGKTFADMISEYPNLIIVRSFSKSFSAAGLRFGYIISSAENCFEINKVIPVFHSNLMTQAFALTMLENKEVFQKHNLKTIERRNALFEQMSKIKGLIVRNTHTNFLIFSAGERSKDLYEHFLANDISVRPVWAHPVLANYLRVSISSDEDNNAFYQALKQFME